MRIVWIIGLLAAAIGQSFAQQTSVDLGRQAHNADFSALPFTRPATMGSTLPSTCTVGQMFFNTAATAGKNLYVCSAVNVWTAIGNYTLTQAGLGVLGGVQLSASSGLTVASDGTLTANVGTAAGTLAAGNDARIKSALQSTNNLNDVANTATALAHLGGVTQAQAAAAAPVQSVAGVAPTGGNVVLSSANLQDAGTLVRTSTTAKQSLQSAISAPQLNGEITVDGTVYTSLAAAYAAASTAAATADQTIRLGPGIYSMAAGLTDPDNGNCVNIVGSGENSTILQASATMTAVISKGRNSNSFHCVYSGFTIDGNALASNGLTIQQGKGWNLSQIKVKRLAPGGEAFLLGNTTDAEAVYEFRLNSLTCQFDATDYPTAANRPANCLHLKGSAHDNLVHELVGWNTTNALVKDDAGSNDFTDIHAYGYPAPAYSPAYAMELGGGDIVTHLSADTMATYGVKVEGMGVTVTNSRFFCSPACAGVFPVYVTSGDDYLTFTDNVITNITSLVLSQVNTPVSWGGTYAPATGSNIERNVGYDPTNSPYNFANWHARGYQVWGEFGKQGPKGGFTFVTPYTVSDTIAIPLLTGQTGKFINALATDGVTSLWSVDNTGKGSFAGGVAIATNTAQPACSVANRGELWYVQAATGTSTADNVQICAKNSADAYVWMYMGLSATATTF